ARVYFSDRRQAQAANRQGAGRRRVAGRHHHRHDAGRPAVRRRAVQGGGRGGALCPRAPRHGRADRGVGRTPRRRVEGPRVTALSPGERAIRQRLKDDFAHYAFKCLKIRAKSGTVVPFALNRVQRLVHEKAQAQLHATGRVRALVLKARQPGISTYIEGRFYWKVTHRRGVRAFILTHRDQATANLLAIVRRFHANVPPPLRPETRASNATELDFGRLDSGYRVGTAKADGI